MGQFKTLGELKGFSSVDITSKSFDEIQSFNDECRKNGNFNLNFPLQEGVFILNVARENMGMPHMLEELINDVKYYIYFKIDLAEDELKVLMEAYMYDTKRFEFMQINASNVKYTMGKGLKIQPLKYTNESKDKYSQLMLTYFRREDCGKMLFQTLLESLIYVGLIQANRKVIYKKTNGISYQKSSTTATKKKTNPYEKVEVLNEDKVMYVLNGKKEAIKSFRSYTRHTESWQVMGHPRHYRKDGEVVKTIWIEPYVKGEGKAKPKSYKIK